MLEEKIELKVPYDVFGCKKDEFKATLTAYVDDDCNEKKQAVIVVPGGAYFFVCVDHEGEPMVSSYRKEGFRTFMLEYSVVPNVFPAALLELYTAIKYVKENADRYGVDADEVYICGFSAGGHLCGSAATLYKEEMFLNALDTNEEVLKVAGAILSYPVITSGEFAHKDSFINLLGMDDVTKSEYYKYVSLEKQVHTGMPPVFIWTTLKDTLVPMENSMLFAQALKNVNADVEFHLYPMGDHGMSRRDVTPDMDEKEKKMRIYINNWFDAAVNWIRNHNL